MTENKDTKMNTVPDSLTMCRLNPQVAIALYLGWVCQIYNFPIHSSYCLNVMKSWHFIGRYAEIQHDSIEVKHYYPSDSLRQERPMPTKGRARGLDPIFQS